MVDEKKGNGITIEWFRLITPILVTVSIFIMGTVNYRVNSIDTKLFQHLTNHELHYPRSLMVSDAVFKEHNRVSEERYKYMEKTLEKFESSIKEYVLRAVK